MNPSLIRQILGLSWPVLVAQLAFMGVAVADTVLAGRYSTADLAGVAIGTSIYITVSLTLVGILQAISPTIAQLHGARDDGAIGSAARQGAWLGLLLGLLGSAILAFPRPLLAWSAPNAVVEDIAVRYLQAAAWGMPAQMLYRTFYAFIAALSRPRPVMVINTIGALVNIPLAYALIYGRLWWPPLGGEGCAVATALTVWILFAAAVVHLASARHYRRYALFSRWEKPDRRQIAAMLRIGLPMGFSNLVEISAFTFIALFIAVLGADVVSGHRIATNLSATCFMLPLSLGNAVAVLVGQALGARDRRRARAVAVNGAILSAMLSAMLATALYLLANPIVGAYTADPAVRAVALSLVGYAAVMHFFDATQTIAAFALRGYKITLGPMIVHVLAFWGVGLAGGYHLCFQLATPMGAAGFWLATVASLVVATCLVGTLLLHVSRVEARG